MGREAKDLADPGITSIYHYWNGVAQLMDSKFYVIISNVRGFGSSTVTARYGLLKFDGDHTISLSHPQLIADTIDDK